MNYQCEAKETYFYELILHFQVAHTNQRVQLMNLSNSRLSQYINLVRILIPSHNTAIKLEILSKNMIISNDLFQFSLNVKSNEKMCDASNIKAYLMIDRSMFNLMHFAVDNANKCFLFPKIKNYNIQIQEDLDVSDDIKYFPKELTPNQKSLIKRILSIKTGQLTPPVNSLYYNSMINHILNFEFYI
jgi:hypothetical protein